MPYTVIWRKLPGKGVVRTETFAHIDDARAEAQLYSLSVPGTVECTIEDAVTGLQTDISVRNNDA